MDGFAYLGTALTSPLSIERGRATIVSKTKTVKQAIERLLGTPRGSVFFNRAYGSRVDELLFEPNTTVLTGLLRHYIHEAIAEWEPRVKFIDMDIRVEDNRCDCFIRYRILASNEVDALIYPFYRKISS